MEEYMIEDNSMKFLIQTDPIFQVAKVRKTYKCCEPSCGKSFSEKGNLNTHKRTHTGERPFICKFKGCTKNFATSGNLRIHEFNHKKEKPYQCDVNGCNKLFARICRLRVHKRTHLNLKPYGCTFCGKLFNEKGNLNTHLRIHTGEKPYKCKELNCNKNFRTQGHMKDHMNRHFDLKPYTCNICNSSFTRSITLKKHAYTHSGERPYRCTLKTCNKTFSENGNRKTHEKTHINDLSNKLDLEKEKILIMETNSMNFIMTPKKTISKNNIQSANKSLISNPFSTNEGEMTFYDFPKVTEFHDNLKSLDTNINLDIFSGNYELLSRNYGYNFYFNQNQDDILD